MKALVGRAQFGANQAPLQMGGGKRKLRLGRARCEIDRGSFEKVQYSRFLIRKPLCFAPIDSQARAP
jgi:hypothetical protein